MRNETNSPQTSPQDIYDLSGHVFGQTTVVKLDHIHKGRRFWLTRCICGIERVMPLHRFKNTTPHCEQCVINKLKASGEATPEDIIALGFDVTFFSRFWSKVNKNGPLPQHRPEIGPCWIWTAGVNGNGYGSLAARFENTRGVMIATHRASWIIANKQQVPEGHGVLHRCDTPRCLRPEHLFTGTDADNNRDMIEKGRAKHAAGEAHQNAKLTDVQVVQIRSLYQSGDWSYKGLAIEFKCSQTLIAVIIRGEAWRHLL